MASDPDRIADRAGALDDDERSTRRQVSRAFRDERESMDNDGRDETFVASAVAGGYLAGGRTGARETGRELGIDPAELSEEDAINASANQNAHIAETTRKSIKNLSDEELDELYDEWSRKRSGLIAGEVVWAGYSWGARRTVGLRDGKKEWVDVGDDRVDAECLSYSALGRIPLAQEFPAGDPPAHIKCRCSVAYYLDEELQPIPRRSH